MMMIVKIMILLAEGQLAGRGLLRTEEPSKVRLFRVFGLLILFQRWSVRTVDVS
jgi:hypothetical protein